MATVVGSAFVTLRVVSVGLSNDISNAVKRAVTGAGPDLDRQGNAIGQRLGKGIGDGTDREMRGNQRNRLNGMFDGIGKDLGKHFNLGFGAARMGEGIISILATAGPSLISGAAAIGTAMAGEIVVAMAAIGPGIAGALGVGLAAVSTLGLNLGLLMLAFKGTGEEAKKFKALFADFKDTLTNTFAPGVLSGFSDMIQNLKDNLLPAITDKLKLTGEAMGNIARKIGDTVTSSDNLRRIGDILTTNKTFLDNFGDGLKGLITAFLILFDAAKPFIDFLGEGVKKFGEWAAASLGVAEANGTLGTWMEGMLQHFKDLWDIIKNFGQGIGDIFSAAAPAGADLLTSIKGIAERFHAWTSDEGNMAKMRTFFEKAHELASKVFEVLGSIFTAAGNAFVGMDLGPIEHVLDTLQNVVGPAIATFFNQIQAGASDNLVKAFDNIGTALTKIADNGTFQVVAGIISGIILKLTEFAATDFGSTILGWILPIALMGGMLTALVGPVVSLFSALGVGSAIMSGLGTVAAALGVSLAGFVAIVAAVVGGFILMWQNSENFRNAIMGLVKAVGGTLMDVWNRLEPKLEVIWGKIQKLAGIIGDRLAPVIEFLTPVIQRVFDFIGTVFGNIVDIVGGVIDFIGALISGDWSGMWTAAGEIVSGLWDLVVTVFEGIKSAISFAWDFITAIFYDVGQVLMGIWTSIWSGVSSVVVGALTWLVDFLTSVGHGIVDIWNGFWTLVWNLIVIVWDAITTAITTALTWIGDGIRNFGNNIQGWWDTFWTAFGNVVTTAWNWIYDHTIQKVIDLYNWLVQKFTELDGWIAGKWEDIKGAASTAWNAFYDNVIEPVKRLAADVMSWINDLPNKMGALWDRIVSIATTAWNGVYDAIVQPVIDAYNAVVGTVADIIAKVQEAIAWAAQLVGIDAAASVPPGAGSTPGTPGLGKTFIDRILGSIVLPVNAAAGGIFPAVSGGTLVRVGEAGRRERIDPIDAQGLSNRDRALIAEIVASMSGSGNTNVKVYLGQTELKSLMTQVVNETSNAMARRANTVRAIPS